MRLDHLSRDQEAIRRQSIATARAKTTRLLRRYVARTTHPKDEAAQRSVEGRL